MNQRMTYLSGFLLCTLSCGMAWGEQLHFIPPGDLPTGSLYQIVFVTADARDASSALITDYNHFVSDQADLNPDLPSGLTWWAVASTTTVDAKVNAQTSENIPIYNTHGERIADGASDLWDGTIQHDIDYNQYGQIANETFVWTGTEPDGTKKHGYGGFVGPLGSDSPYISFGSSTFTDYKWIDRGSLLDRYEMHSLYGISSPMTVIIVPEPGALTLLGLGVVGLAFFRKNGRQFASSGQRKFIKNNLIES